MTTSWNKPLPTIVGETKPFWDSCRRGQLVIQRCVDCGQYQWYPRGICADCWTDTIEWVQASGRGTVWTYTVTQQNRTTGFADMVPYVLALVELEEGIKHVHQHRGLQPPRRPHRHGRRGHLPDRNPPDHHPLLQTRLLTHRHNPFFSAQAGRVPASCFSSKIQCLKISSCVPVRRRIIVSPSSSQTSNQSCSMWHSQYPDISPESRWARKLCSSGSPATSLSIT